MRFDACDAASGSPASATPSQRDFGRSSHACTALPVVDPLRDVDGARERLDGPSQLESRLDAEDRAGRVAGQPRRGRPTGARRRLGVGAIAALDPVVPRAEIACEY